MLIKLYKNNKNIGIYNIIAEIINVYSGDIYKIKILNEENKFFQKVKNIYFTLIKKVDKKFLKKLNLDYQKIL